MPTSDDAQPATYTVTLYDRATNDEIDGYYGVVAWALPGGSWFQVTYDDGVSDLIQVDPAHGLRFTPDLD